MSQISMENYTRNLPHWQPADGIFFVTFRLANSLPKHVLDELLSEREREEKNLQLHFQGDQLLHERYKLNKKLFGRYDAWLDQCLEDSPRWLVQEDIACTVIQEIQHFGWRALPSDGFLHHAQSCTPAGGYVYI